MADRFATANGVPVHRGRVTMLRRGPWRAELETVSLDADELAGPVTIVIAGVTLQGTADPSRTGTDAGGSTSVLVVGGAGGLDDELEPQGYTATDVGTVLGDILGGAEEVLSPSVASSVLVAPLVRWTRVRGAAQAQLDTLTNYLGLSWRVLDDGTVWVGEETWPEAPTRGLVTREEDPRTAQVDVDVDAPSLRPGQSLAGRNIQAVAFELSPGGLRASVDFGLSASARFDASVRRIASEADAYQSPYEAKVLAQNGDGTLELRVLDDRIPPLSRVPYLAGAPGLELNFAQGAVVALEFLNGDETRPTVTGYARNGLDHIKVQSGTKHVARVDDTVDVGTLLLTTVMLPAPAFLVQHLAPNGTPTGPPVPVPGIVPTLAGVAQVPLSGLITSGTEYLRA